MARPEGSENREIEDVEAEASCPREATSNSQPNNQFEILEQFMLALVAMQQKQHQILQFLMNAQVNRASLLWLLS